jgi:hypothetical protein
VDFWETWTLCPVQDVVPEMVILGVDPEDIESLSLELAAATQFRINQIRCQILISD